MQDCVWCKDPHCNFVGYWYDHYYMPKEFPEALVKYEDIYGHLLTYKRNDNGCFNPSEIHSIEGYRKSLVRELCFDWTPGQEFTCGCFPKSCHECRIHTLKSAMTKEIKRSKELNGVSEELSDEIVRLNRELHRGRRARV